MQDKLPKHNTSVTPMFSKEDHDFLDMLFDKMLSLTDMDDMDMSDDDTPGMMALELKAAELEVTVDELVQQIEC
tara:strand:+ start:169 stop:390 length:222 start_codon:yes stop_codon:yes gene_type:complete